MTETHFSSDIDVEITLEELEYIEAKFAAEKAAGKVSEDTQFMYAWALIRSLYRDDRLLGIQEFEDILKKYPERKRECLFFLSSAYYKVGEFKSALKYVNDLLQIEPYNRQALELKKKIEKKVTTDGIMGLAVVGGIVAAAAGVTLVLLRSKRR